MSAKKSKSILNIFGSPEQVSNHKGNKIMKTLGTQKTEVAIPFDGFYESVIGGMVANEIESFIEYHNEENDNKIEYDDIDYDIDYAGLSKAYLEAYSDWSEIPIEFSTMTSPKEYNFQTDRIFGMVKDSDLKRLHTEFLKGEYSQGIVNRNFKSRSGFMSFYDDFCEEWDTKPLDEWDYNELALLMPQPDYYEDFECNGEVSDHVKITINKS